MLSQVARILKWMCAFTVAVGIAQLLYPVPWSMWVIAIVAAIAYSIGFKSNDWQMQIIAAGLIFGIIKCFYGG